MGLKAFALQTVCVLTPAILLSPLCEGAVASSSELAEKIPATEDIKSLPTTKLNAGYIDALKRASDFDDYSINCKLLTHKDEGWKNFGGAQLFYKRQDLLRAVIKSSDYRDGSVVVKQSDGKVRGRGGGLLKAMKMTIEPDSRTIRLPTGYSLVKSDFSSLYDSLKSSLSKGVVASGTSTAVSLRPFKEPVMVLVLNSGVGADSQIVEVVLLEPKSKVPVAWITYKDGKPSAFVSFEGLVTNKGLTDDMFRI